MFKVGDQVYQVSNTKSIPKGQIGEVKQLMPNLYGAYQAYEIYFIVGPRKLLRLRYENEIAAFTPTMMSAAMGGPLPVGAAQTVGKPLYKVGDQVTCIKTASSYWTQSGKVNKVNTSVSPWIYTVEFGTNLHGHYLEKDLIASTRPMPVPPAQMAAAAKSLKNPFMGVNGFFSNKGKTTAPIKTKGPCCCGALHTSNPNCHAHWCDAS